MPEQIFSLTPANYKDCQALFRGPKNDEYYEGDYWLENAPFVRVTCERATVGPVSIASIHAMNRQFFRRNRSHIRKDNLDVVVLWFVGKGRLRFSNHVGKLTISPGDFLLTQSVHPFYIECEPAANDCCEIVTIVVPRLIAREFIAFEGHPAICPTSSPAEVGMAEMLIRNALENSDALGEDTSRYLVETALKLIGTAILATGEFGTVSRRVLDRRYDGIVRYMEENIGDPALCPRATALALRRLHASSRQYPGVAGHLFFRSHVAQADGDGARPPDLGGPRRHIHRRNRL